MLQYWAIGSGKMPSRLLHFPFRADDDAIRSQEALQGAVKMAADTETIFAHGSKMARVLPVPLDGSGWGLSTTQQEKPPLCLKKCYFLP
jgi:hypothetical protein